MAENYKGTINTDIFIEGFPGNIDVDWDLNLFANSAKVYNHELCRLACRLVVVGYDKIVDDARAEAESGFPFTQVALRDTLKAMGMEHYEIQPKAERDEVSYFIASRDVTFGDETYNLILAAFIGSYKKTWYSNFDPYGVDRVANGGKGYAGDDEKGIIHLGFADARDFMHGRITAFLKKYASGKPLKVLLMGHSRGAATANLLAAKVLLAGGFGEGFDVDSDNLFAYCFATPNFADGQKVNVADPRFTQIYNIVSPEDFVTEVLPRNCGFGKYGTVFALMGKDNTGLDTYRTEKEGMQPFYQQYKTEKVYMSYKKGNSAVQKVTKVMEASMPNLDLFYTKKMKECFNNYTPFEYYKYTLCGYVSGNDTPEDQANVNRAMKLMLGSAFDLIGTCATYRNLSKFFVFKEGIGGATGNKLGATYFSDSHRCETYLAYLMAMSEEQLKENTLKY